MRITLLTLLFIFIANYLQSNEISKIDSLTSALESSRPKEKAGIYYSLSKAFYNKNDFQKANEHARKYLKIAEKTNVTEWIPHAYNIVARYHLSGSRFDSIIHFSTLAKDISLETGNREETSTAYEYLGIAYYYKGEFDNAYTNWKNSLEIKRDLNQEKQVATLLNNLGTIYRIWGDYGKAIQYHQDALKIHENLMDSLNIARDIANIGNVYFYFGIDQQKALSYYTKALDLFRALDDKRNLANIQNNIGNIYLEKEEYQKAKTLFEESLEIFNDLEDQVGIANTFNHLGSANQSLENYPLALGYFQQAQQIFKALGDKKNYALAYAFIASVYSDMGQHQQALGNYFSFLDLAKNLSLKKEMADMHQEISGVYEKMGDYKNALKYHKQYNALKDSIINEENLNQISELEAKYETEKKENQLKLNKAQIEKQSLENKRQRVLIILFIFGLLAILAVSILLYRQFKIKKKANSLLQEQNEEIKAQRDKIFEQNEKITDSINYAGLIQTAILPPSRLFDNVFDEYFVLFRPRDIVSGDFYFITRKNDCIFVSVADCTGHGVPGAFMSMLGMAYLNEIITKSNITETDEILNVLRDRVVESLRQTGESDEAKDGMDISFCKIDYNKMELQYSGAFNPLYIMSGEEIDIVQADRMPIGIHTKGRLNFTKETRKIKKGDLLYMFSDGYPDQFGGEKAKKFMIKPFRKLLFENRHHPLSKQKEILNQTIVDWMNGMEQIDDITVMGIKI